MQHPEYNPKRVHAFVCDITSQDLPLTISEPCIDVISSIFCFSALQPCTMKMAAENLHKVLKPGGLILFRDYAVGDLAMKRFKQESKIEENLYHRQDGTLSYFFSKEILSEIFESVGFQIQDAEYVRKTVVNRKQELEMERVFIQARIRKP
jgi:methyltransferase-like protein 6